MASPVLCASIENCGNDSLDFLMRPFFLTNVSCKIEMHCRPPEIFVDLGYSGNEAPAKFKFGS